MKWNKETFFCLLVILDIIETKERANLFRTSLIPSFLGEIVFSPRFCLYRLIYQKNVKMKRGLFSRKPPPGITLNLLTVSLNYDIVSP
jgi:hypothetical protein